MILHSQKVKKILIIGISIINLIIRYDLFVFSDTIFKVNIYKYFQDFPFLMIFINKPISTNDKLKENELYFDNLKDLDSIYQKIYQFIQEP